MVVIAKSPRIESRKDGLFFIIQFTDEKTLNSLDGNDYLYLAHLLLENDKDPETGFTVLQSSGRFFSSGANFSSITAQNAQNSSGELPNWVSAFLSRNTYVTNAFIVHSKPIVCCLNGPAVGLTAAIVMLCDIVYSMNDKVYLQFPFAKIGLVTEGSTSITLPLKIGYARAQNILFFNKPLTYDVLENTVSVKNYQLDDWRIFNRQSLDDLKTNVEGLNLSSMIGMKKLIKETWMQHLHRANVSEVTDAMPFWIDGIPQSNFLKLLTKAESNRSKSKL
ncbi:unnamed protein product [Kluyveromyces dobzhanskii CBS 2104]|uniref:WGS project CCBQ000000000 data, contig MAT n=1 Tax=Kluyveromyces dobzhanskii CBS 2104 TaxID=1427455 RepID=A0A0A8L1W5_9SACH|nr:unnamed protein product [Kluyveromyces dobzhanskii CBS 2104]